MSRPTEAEFLEHVRTEFDYLTKRFGFAPAHTDPGLETFHALYESETAFVSIRGVDFGGGTEVRLGELPFKGRWSGWPLNLIIDLRAPHLHPQSWWDVGGQLKQATSAGKHLPEVCADILTGDLSAAPQFDAEVLRRKQQNEAAWKEHDAELKHTLAVARANEAFRKKDFRTVVRELESVRDRLTPSELKKLDYSKRHLN